MALSLLIGGIDRSDRIAGALERIGLLETVAEALVPARDLSESEASRLNALLASSPAVGSARLEGCRLIRTRTVDGICERADPDAWFRRTMRVDLRTVSPWALKAGDAHPDGRWKSSLRFPFRADYANQHRRKVEFSRQALDEARRRLGWGTAAALAKAEALLEEFGDGARTNTTVFERCNGKESINVSAAEPILFLRTEDAPEIRALLARYMRTHCSPAE